MCIASRVAAAALAMLCVATMANADVIEGGGAGISVVVDPGVLVRPGVMSYTVRLVGEGSDEPVSWDGVFTGPMIQIKAPTPRPGEMRLFATLDDMMMVFPPIEESLDTHFLFLNANMLIAEYPAETDTTLSGAFAWTAPFGPSRDLARIVLPVGQTALMAGWAANYAGTRFETIATIPEPASLSLLGLGVLGLLRRRR